MQAVVHPRESERLAALRETGVLDTAPNPTYEGLVRLAAGLLEAPMAIVSLVDEDRQWFAGAYGVDCRQTPRDIALCAHGILRDEPMIVEDAAADPRFADSPLVSHDPGIRFYAGVPLKTACGLPLGMLCVADTSPRGVTEDQVETLRLLGAFVAAQLELSRRTNQLHRQLALNQMLVEGATDYAMVTLDAGGLVTSWNAGAERLKGYTAAEMLGRHYRDLFPVRGTRERRTGSAAGPRFGERTRRLLRLAGPKGRRPHPHHGYAHLRPRRPAGL